MPGIIWLKNFLGMSVPEEELSQVPYPRLEMTTHVTLKTAQLGVIGGTLVVGPAVALYNTPDLHSLSLRAVTRHALRFGKYGVLLGMAAGPALTAYNGRYKPKEEVQVECYKLRKNLYQCRVDRSSGAGALLGLAAASPGAPVLGLLLGTLLGEMYQSFVGRNDHISLEEHLKQEAAIRQIYAYDRTN